MKKWMIALLLTVACVFSVMVMAAEEEVVSVELDQWQSPVKEVLKTNEVGLEGVDIKNKTFYIFYVTFPKALTIENEAYFNQVVQGIAAAHKFQSFQIEDSSNEIYIGVECKSGKVSQVIFNENANFFADLKAFMEKQKQLADAIMKGVPEVAGLAKNVEKNKGKLVIRIEREPVADGADKYEKDFYLMTIAQIKEEEEMYIDECLISKDAKTVLWYDAENDKYLTAAEWNTKIKKEPYWSLE